MQLNKYPCTQHSEPILKELMLRADLEGYNSCPRVSL
jgi:hypothetical protein